MPPSLGGESFSRRKMYCTFFKNAGGKMRKLSLLIILVSVVLGLALTGCIEQYGVRIEGGSKPTKGGGTVASNPEPDPITERSRASTTISGEIPSPVNVGAGCRFASRCPKVMDICQKTTPPLISLKDDGNRQVACHLF